MIGIDGQKVNINALRGTLTENELALEIMAVEIEHGFAGWCVCGNPMGLVTEEGGIQVPICDDCGIRAAAHRTMRHLVA